MTQGLGSRSRRRTAATGWQLVSGGLVLLACYAVLVWTAVYGNDQAEQPCDGPHRDVVFPPATVCGVGGDTVRITSPVTTVAASVLLLIALGLLVAGVVALVRARRPVVRATARDR